MKDSLFFCSLQEAALLLTFFSFFLLLLLLLLLFGVDKLLQDKTRERKRERERERRSRTFLAFSFSKHASNSPQKKTHVLTKAHDKPKLIYVATKLGTKQKLMSVVVTKLVTKLASGNSCSYSFQ
jgi:hypothetical protein